ncbi:YadA-like family protein, partial [Campylobacter ureolyticus]|uniref:YadA family autotransporter adhesin n=1 Tax=Campylobacter ureolyticus TaxID=827 RepID=UPI0022B3B478
TNNNKTYTFGDTNLGDTSVITNKDLTEKGYVTADTQKTTSVSTDANSGIKVVSEATGNNTDYKLSLDETKIKEITGTTNLTADLDKKADKNAGNLEAGDITSWQNKLGINDKADKSDITNLTTKIDSGNFISLSVSANSGATDEIKANENIDFSGANGINVNYDATKNKFTFSADIDSIADNNVFSNKYAMLDGSNLKAAQGFKQDVWREALGLTNDSIANIFEQGKDISITKNSNNNKYTIAYTGKGTGTGGISKHEVEKIIKEYIGGDIKDPKSKNKLITHNVSEQKTTENENIIAAINKINKEGIGFVHVNGGKIEPEANGKSINDSSAEGENAIAIGPRSKAIGNNSIAIGVGNVVKGENSGAIGDPSIINAKNSYSVGNNNKIEASTTSNNFILGNNAEITSSNSVALGESTKVSVEGGVALGARSVSSREIGKESGYDISTDSASTSKDATWLSTAGAVAVGDETQGITRQITGVAAGSQDTDAVNVAQLKAVQKISQSAQWISVNNENNLPKSQAGKGDVKGYTGNNSVAIGPGSTTKIGSTAEGKPLYRENTVSVGGVTKDKNGKNVLTQRTISNVAPGVLDSDAATMGQLRAGLNDVYGKLGEYKKDASAGTASALAVGNLPQATIPGKGMVSLGSGFYDGESAMAIGLSKMSDSGKWVFKGSASYDSQEKAGAALSVGFHF